MRALLWLLLAAGDPRAQLEALKARKAAEEAAARLLADRERSILDTLGEAEDSIKEPPVAPCAPQLPMCHAAQ